MFSKSFDHTMSAKHAEFETYPKLGAWLGRVVTACIYLAVFLVPLFFLPFTLDVLELNKQALLILLASTGVIAWLGQAMCLRQINLSRSWMHLVVVVFTLGYAVTSFFSQDRFLSFVGNFGQMQWAFASILAFALFYLLIVNTVKSTSSLYNLILVFLGSSTLAGILGWLQFMELFPLRWLGDFTKTDAFNTVGTINSLGVFMVLPLILSASLTVLGCKDSTCVLGGEGRRSSSAKALVWASLIVSIFVAMAVDYWVIWASILFGTSLLVAITFIRARHVSHSMQIVVPSVLVVLSIGLLLFKTPINLKLPAEVSPSASASWGIARQTLQEKPLFGSGPGTWIYDYAKYRQPGVNQTEYWTVRFERGLSAFLSLLPMIGLVGVGLWLILIISGVVKSATHLVKEKNDDSWQAYLTVFSAWATLVFIALLYNYNFSHHFAFWFLLALLGTLVSKGQVSWDARRSILSSSILSLVFLFATIGIISVVWLSGQRFFADMKFAQAVNSFRGGKPIELAVNSLQSAVSLNKWNDAYVRNLSQAFLVRASQELQAQADPERTRKVNASVSLAVDYARKATEITPANVDNWANYAFVMQSIASFTTGADETAIEMYKQASLREPNNPAFATEIGKIHILRSDAYRQLSQSDDQEFRKTAEQNIKAELEKASEILNQAIQVKPDYAPAHYTLGLVYERLGRVSESIDKLEQVLRADSKNVGIGFQLAILYYRNNEKGKAQDLLEQIVAFDTNYSNARWYLSALYEEKGRYDDAIAQIRKVKELNPGNQTVDERLMALTSLRDSQAKPSVSPLPEPVREEVAGSNQQNQVKR